jgi:hypothetical protein
MFGMAALRQKRSFWNYRWVGSRRIRRYKLESTVRYLGNEVDDALNIAQQIEL